MQGTSLQRVTNVLWQTEEFSGIALPSTMMFDFPSVKLISEFIDTGMREAHEKSVKDAPAGGGGGGAGGGGGGGGGGVSG